MERMNLTGDKVKKMQTAAKLPGALDRLRKMAASGPLNRQDIDSHLICAGWCEQYDDLPATDLVDGASHALFDIDGTVRKIWC